MSTRSTRLSPSEFAAKWSRATTTERASAQTHFNDLCDMLGVQAPHEADPAGEWYAFEKGAEKSGGGDGFADVWKRAHFGWEYKGKHKDLAAAYQQLLQYREALENPPLLVVCDLDRFEVRTAFNNTVTQLHEFDLDDFRTRPEYVLRILRAVMQSPDDLRPEQTTEEITQQAAARFALIAAGLHERGHDPEEVAHFLNRVLFCFFAEDAGLLPGKVLSQTIEATRHRPEDFTGRLRDLFGAMSAREERYFGPLAIQWFNGGLFDTDAVLELDERELGIVAEAAKLDWSQVEPAILGTLFERGLDPDKRGQLGAHYTGTQSILRVVEPVVMTPLRREFAAMQERVEALLGKEPKRQAPPAGGRRPRQVRAPRATPAVREFLAFLARLRDVRVLDPACGSGNFLYVTLRLLKDLEKEASQWGFVRLEIPYPQPQVDPQVVLGIELNPYAAELARTSIWIGHIQWMLANGFNYRSDPILQPLDNIACGDAVLDEDAEGAPVPAEWPEAEFIVGNPPFIGGKLMRRQLSDGYVDRLFEAWEGRVPREADFVAYWHEQARAEIERGRVKRAGLLATNSIRGGANREVLERIKGTGDIFAAWSDEPWVVGGAAVRVSIVAQDAGEEAERALDGSKVEAIFADLTGRGSDAVDLTRAARLAENAGVSFMGDTKGGAFDIDRETARALLLAGGNVHGRPNSEVVVPWANGLDVTRRPRGMFIIDFDQAAESEAAAYEAPFTYLQEHVQPVRATNRREAYRERWWRHVEPRPAMRAALAPLPRFIVTPTVAKYRLFAWEQHPTLPDHQLIAIAREDDYTFGVLHSRAHERWALRLGTWLGKGNDPRYTPTTTFETFAFPWPLDTPDDALTSEQCVHRDAIAEAARELDAQRVAWLNPPDLVREEPDVVAALPPRLVPVEYPERDGEEPGSWAARELRKRTLTNLYNDRPRWLALAHEALDRAVLAAYGWPADIEEEEMLRRLLALNHERAE